MYRKNKNWDSISFETDYISNLSRTIEGKLSRKHGPETTIDIVDVSIRTINNSYNNVEHHVTVLYALIDHEEPKEIT
jgi:hypothetical protein